jgi:4-oxalocrotonate tautomerase
VPLVEITLAAGRSPTQLRALIHEVHEAVVHALSGDPANVRVLLRELPAEHWAAGDITLAERRGNAAPGPCTGTDRKE